MDTSELFDGYGPVAGFDEMFADADIRDNYGTIHESFLKMGAEEIRLRADSLASSYLEQGVTFGVAGEERPFPLDIVPRLIESEDWQHVEPAYASACSRWSGSLPTPMAPASCSPMAWFPVKPS